MSVRYVRGSSLTPFALRKLAEPMQEWSPMKEWSHLSYFRTRHDSTWRPKRDQMTLKEQDDSVHRLAEWLASIGAVKGDYYDFRVETLYGWLEISPIGNGVHCRFDDVDRAQPITGFSYSGKWNHYYFDVSRLSHVRGKRCTGAELFQHFMSQIASMLPAA